MVVDPNASTPSQRRILVVEDSDDLRALVCSVLKRSGFAVMDAACAESALVIAASHAIDAVLTDVEMPGMNGIELCRKLSQPDVHLRRAVPVWIMTGAGIPDLDTRAHEAGAKGIFRKPFNTARIAEAFENEFR